MSDIEAQFSLLHQSADPAVADTIVRLIRDGKDHELNRVNALDFSKRTGLDEEKTISGFLQASKLGLFAIHFGSVRFIAYRRHARLMAARAAAPQLEAARVA